MSNNICQVVGAEEPEQLTSLLLLRLVSVVLLAIWLAAICSVSPIVLVDHGIVSMGLDMLLEVLRPLEGLSTEVASMRLQWYMYPDVRGDVVPFHDGDTAATPSASEVEVVSALAPNVGLTDVILCGLSAKS